MDRHDLQLQGIAVQAPHDLESRRLLLIIREWAVAFEETERIFLPKSTHRLALDTGEVLRGETGGEEGRSPRRWGSRSAALLTLSKMRSVRAPVSSRALTTPNSVSRLLRWSWEIVTPSWGARSTRGTRRSVAPAAFRRNLPPG